MPRRPATGAPKARPLPAGFFASALAAALLLAASPAARANDRPFQVARTAIAEDDDNTWSVETWFTRLGSVRGFSVEPEYTFDPHHSVQMEFTRTLDRHGADTGHAAEVEYKYLFNRFDRDGYGVGLSVALGVDRVQGDEDGPRRSVKSLSLKLPVSVAIGDSSLKLHLNPGWAKSSDARGSAVAAIGAEFTVARRGMLFAEWSSQRGERHAQVGLRWWVTKEKVALDIAAVRTRVDGERSTGFIAGIGLYDL